MSFGMSEKAAWATACGVLALIVAAGCAKKEEPEAEPVIPVQVVTVRTEPIRRIVDGDAVLYPQNQASVVPKISAPVRAIYVNRGDHVHEGQLLAVLENKDLSAAAQESKGQFEQAEANYRGTASASVPEEVVKAESDVQADKEAADAARKVWESRQKLFEQGAFARKLVDDAQVAYVQARSQLEAAQEHLRALQSVGKQEQIKGAEAQVATAKAHYEGAAAQLGYSEVRTPIAGVIADRSIYPGEMAAAGSPLATVMDISHVVARANIPQAQAGYVKVGAPATIRAGGTAEAQGKVTVVSPAVDPNSTTVQVWVQAANPGDRLKPGFTVHVSILAETIQGAIVVPAVALLPGESGGSKVVVVSSDSVAHLRPVEVGVRDGDRVQILEGVKPGEQVVTQGGLGLEDGAKVRTEKQSS
jgi:multidrug efflux pump subunit AcrA (membrane-fusion protein)